MLLRRVARPMLAAVFVSGGLDTLLNPEPKAEVAAPLLDKAGDALPVDEPPGNITMVQLDAVVKVVAGALLATNRLPRLASAALAASLIPTTVGGHAFWNETDKATRTEQQIHFMKNVGLLGGLLLASADTHGKPSLGWWTRRALRKAGITVQHAADTVQHAADTAVDTVTDTAAGTVDRVRSVVR